MIRPYNINAVAKTASFKCDKHDAYVEDYDLTLLSYETEPGGLDILCIKPNILDSGTDLVTCQAILTCSSFPRIDGPQLALDLIAAKDA